MQKQLLSFSFEAHKQKTKIWLLTLFFAVFFGISQAYGACQTVDFWDGKSFCFDILKTSNEFYRTEISQKRWDLTDLNCTLTLPNTDTVKLNACAGDFRYNGAGNLIELRAELGSRYFSLASNYDFLRGSFDTNYLNTDTQYRNFQAVFTDVSSERVSRNQWIDLTLRVRNTGTSTAYFDGTIDFSVEERRDGSWRSAYSSDYRLDRSNVNYSRSEEGEKNLNSFLRFSDEGEFRLIAKIRNTNSRTSQTFYVNDESYRTSWDSSYSRSSLSYTNKEYEKLRAVAEIWQEVIRQLKTTYPKLNNSSEWQRRSDLFYSNMQEALRGRSSATFYSRNKFYSAFHERLSFTIHTR